MTYIKMFEGMPENDSIISILQDNTRSRDPKKSESAKEALKLRPTLLYLRAQKSGVLYDDKSFNKAFSTYDLAAANDVAPKVDKAIAASSEKLGKARLAAKAHTEDSKQYAQCMLDYYNAQEEENKLWNEFIQALGHNKSKQPVVFSEELQSMGTDALRKLLPIWPIRWIVDLQNSNSPTGDPEKRKTLAHKMHNLLKKKGADKEVVDDEPPIGLDDEDSPEEKLKLRKANRKMAGKPAALKPTAAQKMKEDEEIEDLLSMPEEDLAKDPKPSLSRIYQYKDWSEENLIMLATEKGIPHKDRNAARNILTKRGVKGYPEPAYTTKSKPEPSVADDEDEIEEPKRVVPMSVSKPDTEEEEEENSIIPKGSMLDQITGGDGPIDRPQVFHPTHDNPHPCRVCGRPESDPCHQ